ELGSGLDAVAVDVTHDVLEASLGLLEAPRVTAGVLLHLQSGGGDTTSVGGLPRGVQHARAPEDLRGTGHARHVRALGDELDAVVDQGARVVLGQFGLGGARQGDVARHVPDGAVGDVTGRTALGLGVVGQAAALDLL